MNNSIRMRSTAVRTVNTVVRSNTRTFTAISKTSNLKSLHTSSRTQFITLGLKSRQSQSQPCNCYSTGSSSASLSTFLSQKYNNIIVEQQGNAIHIIFNRPTLHNAFNAEFIVEMNVILKTLHSNLTSSDWSSIRAVVLRSNGKSFCAGADLNYMRSMQSFTYEQNLEDSHALHSMISLLSTLPVPTIASVKGNVLGGGVGVVSAVDICIAQKGSVFGLTEVKLGLAPAIISKFVMDKIGKAAALQYFLTGERFPETAAERIGLVSYISENEEDSTSKLNELISNISNNGPIAVQKTKELINTVSQTSSGQLSDDHIRDYCCKLISQLRVSEEGQEGIASFFEKRSPKWIVHSANTKKSS